MKWNFNFLIKLNKNKLLRNAINQVYQCEQTECLNPHVNPWLVFGSSKNSSQILFFMQIPFTYRTWFTIWKMPFKITFLACSEFMHLEKLIFNRWRLLYRHYKTEFYKLSKWGLTMLTFWENNILVLEAK